jgi:hypothetical protein
VKKPEEKRLLVIPWRTYNIMLDLKDMGWGIADCGLLNKYRDKGRVFVKTILNLTLQERS